MTRLFYLSSCGGALVLFWLLFMPSIIRGNLWAFCGPVSIFFDILSFMHAGRPPLPRELGLAIVAVALLLFSLCALQSKTTPSWRVGAFFSFVAYLLLNLMAIIQAGA